MKKRPLAKISVLLDSLTLKKKCNTIWEVHLGEVEAVFNQKLAWKTTRTSPRYRPSVESRLL